VLRGEDVLEGWKEGSAVSGLLDSSFEEVCGLEEDG